MPEGDADKLTDFVQCKTEWHAESIAAALRARGIASQAEGGMAAGWQAEAPTKWRVMVFTRDLLAARLLLSELKTEGASIDWDAVDVGEHVEGVPEPAGKIGDEPVDAEAGGRTRALLLTVGVMVAAVVALVISKACTPQ
jgi:hypothetical protein